MQKAINGTIETEQINILTLDENMGERLDTDDEETREELPAKKNVIKRRTILTRRNLKTLTKAKRKGREKRVQEASTPVSLNWC